MHPDISTTTDDPGRSSADDPVGAIADEPMEADTLDSYFDEAVVSPSGRRRRVPAVTLVLVVLFVASIAFVGGLVAQQAREPEAAALPGGGAGFPGGELPAGFELPEGVDLPAGFPGADTGADSGTDATGDGAGDPTTTEPDTTIAGEVTLSDSGNLYLDVGASAPVKVTFDDTVVVVDATAEPPEIVTADEVAVGAHVMVDGERTADGDLAATTVVVTKAAQDPDASD